MNRIINEIERRWLNAAMNRMSLREKIAQTAVEHIEKLMDPSLLHDEDAISSFLVEHPIGGLFIGGEIIKQANGNAEQYYALTERFQRNSAFPLLVSGDLESGAGSAVSTLTRFPSMMGVGAADDSGLAYELGKYTALEGLSAGFNWSFSPVADLSLNWLNPIVGRRSLGDNPEKVTQLAADIIRGMQEYGMASCAKHFPGDGVDFRDQHVCTSVNHLSESDWRTQFGSIYHKLIETDVYTIMIGHIALPWKDSFNQERNRYRPATVSGPIVTDLLRKDLGFEGLIVSDALNMGGYAGWDTYERRVVDSFNSGMDMLLWPGKSYMEVMLHALEDGRISLYRLDEAVRRVLELKLKLELISPVRDEQYPINAEGPVQVGKKIAEQAKTLNQRLSSKSVTLARNLKGTLPLDATKVRSILVIDLSKSGIQAMMPSWLDHFQARGAEITIVYDFEPWEKLDYVSEMEKKGKRWDACVVLFQDHAINNARPAGAIAKGLWALQNADTLDPIFISMSTPFLLYDIPYADTLLNMYSETEPLIEAAVKTMYGELPFNCYSPVALGGWSN